MITVLLLVSSAGLNSFLMPMSPIGNTTGFAMAGDAEALFYNPAHFEAGDAYRVACYYNQHYLDMSSVSLGLSRRVGLFDLGVAVVNYDYGAIEYRPDFPTQDPTIDFTANDLSIGLCGGIALNECSRFGCMLKYLGENIYVYSDYTFAWDMALAYRGPRSGISIGITNFGGKLMLKDEEVNLPTRLSAGAYQRLARWVGSIDVHYLVNNGRFDLAAGVDLPFEPVDITLGVNYRGKLYPGFSVAFARERLKIKYGGTVAPYNLGLTNSLGVAFDF